ncbi:hypothetical protein SLE2022_343160 [Rubroshorea leprosula]
MSNTQQDYKKEDDDQVPLPGFRFHPTDEELLGFYLKRKVERKPLQIELIKQIDIYKHDPWDLPKPSTVGDNESYFFCKRGRKYRNSIRPNRVTGSGFWKATGIDKPVYSRGGEGHDCIGLKKTLVYYRGSAGKGTKTDWMMHEFRLPGNNNDTSKSSNDKFSTQEAEVWTICRIFKRNSSQRKLFIPVQSRENAKRHSTDHHHQTSSSKACGMESNNKESYISFGAPAAIDIHHHHFHDQKPVVNHSNIINNEGGSMQWQQGEQCMSIVTHGHQLVSTMVSTSPSSFSDFPEGNINYDQLFTYGNWDELRSVVEFSMDPSLL